MWSTDRYSIDPERRQLTVAGQAVELEAMPFTLLLFLTERSRQVVTREEIKQALWGGDAPSEAALARCIHKVRIALQDNDHLALRTIYGIGYQLRLSAVRLDSRQSPPADEAAD